MRNPIEKKMRICTNSSFFINGCNRDWFQKNREKKEHKKTCRKLSKNYSILFFLKKWTHMKKVKIDGFHVEKSESEWYGWEQSEWEHHWWEWWWTDVLLEMMNKRVVWIEKQKKDSISQDDEQLEVVDWLFALTHHKEIEKWTSAASSHWIILLF